MRRALPPLLALVLALVLLTGCEFSLERLAHGGALPPPPEDYTGLQDGFRYTKTTLTGQERYLYDQLLAGLQNQEETIGDLYPDTEMIQTAIDAIDRDYPELFWFSGTGQIETTLLAGKPLEAAYTPVYTMDQAQRQATQAQIDQWAADCFATIPQGASDYDKALGVFTYIIQHADYQVVDNNSIVNIMVGGAGLCGCYAKTTQYLLGLLGVDTAYITGQAQGESHAWNLAWLDGTPCWIDTTWGDPVFTGGDDSQGPAYEYFGLTTDDLLRTHTIDDKVPVPDCTSNSNNYFFRNGLYFSAYDPDALTALFQRALAAGQRQVSVRYADAAYPAACAALFDQGQLNTLLGRAREALDSPVSLAGSLWYTRNETMGTLSFLLPLSSSPGAADDDVRLDAVLVHGRLGLQADDALVEQHLVEHRPQHIAVALLAGGGLHRLRDGAAQGASGARVLGQDLPPHGGGLRGGGGHRSAVGPHDLPAEGLLLIAMYTWQSRPR